jgi:hypothetical protein
MTEENDNKLLNNINHDNINHDKIDFHFQLITGNQFYFFDSNSNAMIKRMKIIPFISEWQK